jgi:hypothetical protein
MPDNPRVHPAISHHEKTGQNAVELTGYIGSERDGLIRIYGALDGTTYVEVKKDDIINISQTEGDGGRARITVRDEMPVATVTRTVAPASAVALSFGTQFNVRPQPAIPSPYSPAKACMDTCESNFAQAALRVKQKQRDAHYQLTHGDYVGAVKTLGEASRMTVDAIMELTSCLTACPGIPFFGGIPAFIQYARSKYLTE